jgi:serine/threonine protein phosphatase 1
MPGRVFAIGDIHGCVAEVETLLGGLELARGDTLVFVGDYIDRGPDSRGVIDLMLDLQRRTDVETVFLKGNHEDMCLAYLGRPGRWGEAWLANGGRHALVSYGVHPDAPPGDVLDAMPDAHLQFLGGLALWHLVPGHLVVHAGVRPERRWTEQDDEDLLWIREDFIRKPHSLPQTIVFGHTPHRAVLVDLPYKIGIDTGCVYGGALTALELGSHEVVQVRRGERRVRHGALHPERVSISALFGGRRT